MANQLPEPGSADERIIDQLRALPPEDFEAVVVALFQEITVVEHEITKTRFVGDGGFDFFGRFTMPLPIGYEIPVRGEVKRYARNQGVGAGEVSRLVARLKRGEFGIFVTTSYYSTKAQKEVIENAYPIRLFAALTWCVFFGN